MGVFRVSPSVEVIMNDSKRQLDVPQIFPENERTEDSCLLWKPVGGKFSPGEKLGNALGLRP
jgi:hypothetical protein